MEDKEKEENEIEGLVLVEPWKPGSCFDLAHQGIAGEDLQPHQEEKQRSAESNEIVWKHCQPIIAKLAF